MGNVYTLTAVVTSTPTHNVFMKMRMGICFLKTKRIVLMNTNIKELSTGQPVSLVTVKFIILNHYQ